MGSAFSGMITNYYSQPQITLHEQTRLLAKRSQALEEALSEMRERLGASELALQNMSRELNEQEAKCNLLESETPSRLSKLETRISGLDDTIHHLDNRVTEQSRAISESELHFNNTMAGIRREQDALEKRLAQQEEVYPESSLTDAVDEFLQDSNHNIDFFPDSVEKRLYQGMSRFWLSLQRKGGKPH